MTDLSYRRRPHAWRYMLGALHPSSGVRAGHPFPELSARWSGYRAGAREIADYTQLCGLPAAHETLPPLFVHAIAFRLQMALLTHRAFPVPIWRVLQVRNDIRDFADVARDATLDFATRVQSHRVLAKGLEVDLVTSISADGSLAAESVNTFYVRGSFGSAAPDANAAESPAPGDEVIASWRMPAGGGTRFGALTGDYNGIHLFDGYARMFGFRRAFFHPLRMVTQSLVHAGLAHGGARRLQVWLRGPVFHDSELELRRRAEREATVLALVTREEPRPAIVMVLTSPPPPTARR